MKQFDLKEDRTPPTEEDGEFGAGEGFYTEETKLIHFVRPKSEQTQDKPGVVTPLSEITDVPLPG